MIPDGQRISTPGGSAAVETLRPGDLVKGFEGADVTIVEVQAVLERVAPRTFYLVTQQDGQSFTVSGDQLVDGTPAASLTPGQVVGRRVDPDGHETAPGVTIAGILAIGGISRSYDLKTENDVGYRIGAVPLNSSL